MAEVDPELSAEERAALQAWVIDAPPADFVERVMQAQRRSGDADEQARSPLWHGARSQWARVAGIVLLVLLGGSALAAGAAGLWAWARGHVELPPSHTEPEASEPAPRVPASEHATSLSPTEPPPSPIPLDLGQRIENYLGGYGHHYGPAFRFQGTVLVARGGAVVYQGSFGQADLDAARSHGLDTRLPMGAISIPITAVAIFQLREQGRLQLDDPVHAHLPELGGTLGRITLRQLLTHRSGVSDVEQLEGFERWSRQAQPLETMIERIGGLPPVPSAGEPPFAPSNANYVLLTAVIEAVSGVSFGQYLQDHVFEPAGMHRSAYHGLDDPQLAAQGYVFNEDEYLEPAPRIHPSVLAGAGGIVSTPRDLLRLDRALFSGRLLGAPALEAMLDDPEGLGYGHGWLRGDVHGRSWVGHPGGVSGFNGQFMHFPADGTFVVAVANTDVVDCREIATATAEIVYGLEPTPHLEYQPIEVEADALERYVGTYVLAPTERDRLQTLFTPHALQWIQAIVIQRDGKRLRMINPMSYIHKWMYPLGEGLFFFKDPVGTLALFDLAEGEDAATSVRLRHPQYEIRLVRQP